MKLIQSASSLLLPIQIRTIPPQVGGRGSCIRKNIRRTIEQGAGIPSGYGRVISRIGRM